MMNIYKQQIMKKYLNEEFIQPNLELYDVVFPRHVIICAGTGGGKSNCLINLMNYYSLDNLIKHFIIVCKTPDEELYRMLRDRLKDKIQFITNLKDLPTFEEHKPVGNTLLIFDDCVADKDQSKIEKYYLGARKKQTQCIYLSQSYFKIPDFIRKQVECGGYIFLLGNYGRTNAMNICKAVGFDKNEFPLFYKILMNATKEPLCALKINTKTSDLNKKLARNFTDFYDIYNNDTDTFFETANVVLYKIGCGII